MAAFPVGSIIFWPTDATPPSGWRVCDGTGGTPDLRGAAVPGAGNTYAVGDAGGVATYAVPSHGHGIGTSDLADATSFHDWAFALESAGAGSTTGFGVVTVGDDAPHTHSATSTFDAFGNTNIPPMRGGDHGHPFSGAYDAAGVGAGSKLPLMLALNYIVRVA